MKMYKFVFTIGLLNILVPFIGVPSMYKQYVYVATGVLAVLYALVVRTVQKEKETGLIQEVPIVSKSEHQTPQAKSQVTRKIEEVVEMEESHIQRTSRIKAKRPTIKAKVVVED